MTALPGWLTAGEAGYRAHVAAKPAEHRAAWTQIAAFAQACVLVAEHYDIGSLTPIELTRLRHRADSLTERFPTDDGTRHDIATTRPIAQLHFVAADLADLVANPRRSDPMLAAPMLAYARSAAHRLVVYLDPRPATAAPDQHCRDCPGSADAPNTQR